MIEIGIADGAQPGRKRGPCEIERLTRPLGIRDHRKIGNEILRGKPGAHLARVAATAVCQRPVMICNTGLAAGLGVTEYDKLQHC